MKRFLIIATALVATTTAVNADGYRAATKFEQVKAECELIANGLPEPRWNTAIGAAIGGLVVHAKNYDNCMVLHGYARQ
jgi:hypothetical protein